MDLIGFVLVLSFGLMGGSCALAGVILWLDYLKKRNLSRPVRYLGSVVVLCLLCSITAVGFYPVTRWMREDELISASAHGDTGAVEFTLRMGIDVNTKEENTGFTPVMFAASNGKTDAVTALLRHHADVNYSTRGGKTALGLAIVNHHPDIARLLQVAGAK